MDWASNGDLEAGWLLRKPIPGDPTKRDALLQRAQNRINRAYREVGLTPELAIEAGLTDAESIKAVQIELALTILRNPLGAVQLAENTGPFGGSMTFSENQRQGMWITEDMYSDLGISPHSTARETGTKKTW